MITFQEIVASDKSSRRGVHVPLVYIDMASDLNAGILLSQIFYWQGRKAGDSIVKKRSEWHDEIRLSEKQYDRAINILKNLGLVTVRLKKSVYHAGATVPHITLNESVFADLYSEKLEGFVETESTEGENGYDKVDTVLPKGQNAFYPKVKTGIDQRSKRSITETITEITTEKHKQKPSYSAIVDLYFKLHEQHTKAKPTFSSVEGKILKTLLSLHTEDIIRCKLELYYKDNSSWYAKDKDFKQFRSHFDKIKLEVKQESGCFEPKKLAYRFAQCPSCGEESEIYKPCKACGEVVE